GVGFILARNRIGNIAVTARTDAAADHDWRIDCGKLIAQLTHQVDGLAVGSCKCSRRVAKLITPVGAGAPGRALQDEARAVRCRNARIAGEIGTQRRRALLVLHQMECREVRELETSVEDQVRLDAAVCEEQAAIKLGEAASKSRHTGDPLPSGLTNLIYL